MPLTPGDRLGPYEIVAPLGAGGMGEVYRARDTRLGREVALKILPPEVSADPSRRQRFESEARAVAALNHPNIVAIHDVAFDQQSAYIVSELVPGETLRALIQRGPVPVRKALDLITQVADGLAAAHAAHIAHRDLKPENLVLTPEGRVKILDFGLAKSIAPAPSHADATRTIASTQPGTIVGTVAYMSPEQAGGNTEIDGRTDQFSLGLIAHELLTGHKAFQRPTAAETMTAIIREDAAPLPANLHGPFRWVIERCLSKERTQRYESTRDLFLELRQLRDHASEIAAAPTQPAAPPKSRRRSLAPLAIVAGLVGGILFGLLWLEAPVTPIRYTPFATEPGIQTMPSWSPAGDRLAYSSEINGRFQIFIRKLGSPTPTQITHQDASCFFPFWSPDGSRVYYIVSPNVLDRSLWSSAVAGGDAEKVLDGVSQATLSPDGKTLAVSALQPDRTYTLMLSSPPGATPRPFPQAEIAQIRSTFFWGLQARFTQDGKYLGLYSLAAGLPVFWKVPMDGGPPQSFLHGVEQGETFNMFFWLPGNSVLWSSITSGDTDLILSDLAKDVSHTVTSGAAQFRYAAISPDLHTVASQKGDQDYDILEIPLNGAPASTVLATDRSEVAPAWAPDGVHFAYSTNRSGWREIWLRNRADGSERMVATARDFPGSRPADNLLDCAVSPDGSRIAYRYMHTGSNPAIFVSSLAGDAPVPVYKDPKGIPQRGPAWSPDGNWIAYYTSWEGKPAVLKVRVGANRPPELVAYSATLNPVRWSPDGNWIVWNDGSKLTIVSPDGKQRRVFGQREWFTYGWSKDGATIYGVGLGPNRHVIVASTDVASAKETIVADLGPAPAAIDLAMVQSDFPYRGFSLNPDGKSFLTSTLKIQGDIWLLEDFNRRPSFLDRLLHRTQ